MEAVFSIPNLAWMVMMGGKLQSVNNRYIWSNKADLAYDLQRCGLKLVKGNKIVSVGDVCTGCSEISPSGGCCKACTMCGTSAG